MRQVVVFDLEGDALRWICELVGHMPSAWCPGSSGSDYGCLMCNRYLGYWDKSKGHLAGTLGRGELRA